MVINHVDKEDQVDGSAKSDGEDREEDSKRCHQPIYSKFNHFMEQIEEAMKNDDVARLEDLWRSNKRNP